MTGTVICWLCLAIYIAWSLIIILEHYDEVKLTGKTACASILLVLFAGYGLFFGAMESAL